MMWLVLPPTIAPRLIAPEIPTDRTRHGSRGSRGSEAVSELNRVSSGGSGNGAGGAGGAGGLESGAESGVINTIPYGVDHRVSMTQQWVEGKLSNLDYLLAINHAVGRTTMDSKFPAMVPWVSVPVC